MQGSTKPVGGSPTLMVPANQREEPPTMFSRSDDVEAHALKKRGWSISAIARHLDRDRKTVRSYLNGEREPGVRSRPETPDPLADYEKYLVARFTDDHHVWGTVLFEEVTRL